MPVDPLQISVFLLITAGIALLTWWQCSKAPAPAGDGNADYFLAGRSLSWIFIAGSITLTNLSTDQLVGMNGAQALVIAWWEFAAVVGLLILAFVFLPLYYKYKCTTTTELLEIRYGSRSIRAVVSLMFLVAGLLIYMPIMLYTGSLFLISMLGLDLPLTVVASGFAIVGAAYALFGGLRAVAISDTYSGVGLLALGLVIVVLAMNAVNWDLSDVPPERLTLIGDNESQIPWHTLLTGMIFIQVFYWSFNQVITQRAMAAPTLKEAQKGVLAAAGIRLLVVPPLIAVPGVVAYQLYGNQGDASFGMLVGDILPGWLSGTFAAMMAAAVLTSFNSALNSGVALYTVDIHERFFAPGAHVRKVATIITVIFIAIAVGLVPLYAQATSIIALVQQLNILLSAPILSVFFLGIFFEGVSPKAGLIALVTGIVSYGTISFVHNPVHYIHMMLITLIFCMALGFVLTRLFEGQWPRRAKGLFATENP